MSVSGRAFVRRAEGGTIMSLLPRLRLAQVLARVATAALVVTPLVVLGTATPAAAVAPSVTVSVTGGGNVIAGNNATYSISATNAGATDGFNLALYLDVPAGLTFVPSGSSLGAPVVYSNADYSSIPLGTFRWVWEDVSDLPSDGTFGGTVVVHPEQPPIVNPGGAETSDVTVFPVGSTYSVTGHAYLGGMASLLPVFDGATGIGGATAIDETGAAAPSSAVTNMIALTLAKSEPSSEAELPRGVHDQTTVYTLTITETTQGDVDNTVLVDFIPAGLEFLGCGGIDNSTIDWEPDDPAVVNEYLDAPSLTGTPLIATNCPTPTSVDTVVASAADATTYGVTAGLVYTRVEWNLDTLALGSVTEVQYAAAVPLYENTITWAPAATPDTTTLLPNGSHGQTANLDNNSGPSTRQGDPTLTGPPTDGHTWTNVANVFADYRGVVRTAAPRATTARTQKTIYAMDLAVQKSITAGGTFNTGEQTEFRLGLQASEYMDSSAIVLTDVMGNGLCPLVPTGTLLINPDGLDVSDCTGIDGVVTGAHVVSVTAHGDGTWDMILQPTSATYPVPGTLILAANEIHTITYTALNRDEYELVPTEYGPTTSGDGFGNTVSFTAVTDAITVLEPWFPPTWNVWDDSGTSMPTDYTTIDKRVMNRGDVTQGLLPGDDPCTSGTATWNADVATGYRFGDTACFELRVNFPSTIDVRNPVVTDFVPEGLTYAGYAIVTGPTGSTTPTTLDAAGGRLEWTLGDIAVIGRPDRYVSRGTTFVAHVWATVDGPSTGDGIAPLDKPENLLKYRQQNVDGVLYFLREQASVLVDPEMQLVKGVESVTPNGIGATADYTREAATQADANGSVFASNRDGILVREGEQVRYRIDLSTMPYDATNATVWDVLPPGIKAADVSDISVGGIPGGGYAADPGGVDDGYPGEASYPGVMMDPTLNARSVVVWTGVDVDYVLHETLNYTVTIPIGTSVATTHDNNASIIRYSADINTDAPGTSAQDYFPVGSFNTLNTGNTPGDGTRDDSSVYLPSATIVKSATSPLGTNNTAAQVVKGEIGEFTYAVTIPAYTSVMNGLLSDAFLSVPSHWSIESALTTIEYPGVDPAPSPGDPGYPGYDGTFTVGSSDNFAINASTGTLDFPDEYINDTASDQTFTVHLFAHVIGTSNWSHGTFRGDQASFSSDTQGTITDDSGLTVITPNPRITKTASSTTVTAGQTVTYRLRARNNSGSRPTAFDTVVTDCVPAELTFGSITAGYVGSVDTTTPIAGCTGQPITWTIGAMPEGTDTSLYYTATVSLAAAGNAAYVNTGRIRAYSLDDEAADRALQTATSAVTIRVVGATITKQVNGLVADTATIGEQAAYTIVVILPADANFYDAAIIDVVPHELLISGVSVDCTYGAALSCLGDLGVGGTELTPSGTTHGWYLGDIASRTYTRTVTLTYTGTVLDDPANTTGHPIPNTAAMRWAINDPVTPAPTSANYTPGATTPTATATLTVIQPNLTIAKLVNGLDSDTVAPGDVFTYGVAVTNALTNASPAYAITVTDVIPTNVIVNPLSISDGGSISGASATTGGGTVSWSLATLAVDSTHTFTYSASLATSEYLDASSLTNVATLTGYSSHPLLTAGFDDDEVRSYPTTPPGPSADAVVTPEFPDPTITKMATAGPAYIGESKGFTITVTNDGDSDAINAEALDTLPANWIYDTGSTLIDSVGAADPAVAGQDLTWSALPDLVPTASFTVYYTAHPDASATWTGLNTGSAVDYQNDVTVTVDDVSPSPENLDGAYTASTSEDVQIHAADLAIDKAHNPALSPTAGSAFSWTLGVTNSATSDPAVGPIVVVDTLPADAVYTGFTATGTGWTDDTSVAGQVTFTHAGPVATNGALPIITVNVTLGADVLNATDFTNVATVSARTFDPDTSNNSDTDPALTVIVADVELVKTSVGGPFTAGETITWNLTATNLGPSVAVAPFVVTDTLPATIDRTTVVTSGAGWSCDPVTLGGILVCTWSTATLGVGDSTDTLVVSATVLPTTVGDVDNTATVTHTTPDPDLDNNTDDTSDTVSTSADLSLTKSTVSVDIPANGTGRFRIEIANAGPSDALNVVVSDALPGGLTFDDTLANLTSAAGDTWTCIPSGGDPTLPLCTLTSNGGTLPLGGTSWFEFDVQADATVTAAVRNIATVGSDTPDPDGDNNTDDSTTAPLLTVNKSANSPVIRRGSQVTYTINVESLSYGATDDVTLIDPIPSALRVDSISLELSTDPTVPDWTDPCVLAGEDLDGYGGTVTCVLDGTLERGRTTPNIIVVATVRPSTTPGTIVNVAEVQWTDPDDLIAGVFSENDDALLSVTLSDAALAASGAMGLPQKLAATLIALTLGVGMVMIARRRRGEDQCA